MPGPRTTIAVVEDSEQVSDALKRLLNAGRYHAVTYPSAEALLGADDMSNAACLVLDVHLPGMSGFELQRKLQELGNQTPVIFISAQDDPSSVMQAHESRAVAFFAKPFRGDQFLSAIAKAIRSPQ